MYLRQGLLIASRYRLDETIGSGGMGRVWLAHDVMLRRDVAIKEVILPDGLTRDEIDEQHQRTLREARAAARLSHPNVVQVFDVIYAEERPWIVMEYVPCRSLYQIINETGPLPPREVARIGLALLAALRAAHAVGVLHRDVKPGNVLLAVDGRVVLTDFGLATFEGVESTLTKEGVIFGSPQFIAPERAYDGTSTAKADLWSMGATLFAAVEGKSPFYRTTAMATLTALATAPPDPSEHAGPLTPVLNGLLEKSPELRMPPDEVERLLREVAAGGQPGHARHIPRQSRRADRPAPATEASRQARAQQADQAQSAVERRARRLRTRRRMSLAAGGLAVAAMAAGIYTLAPNSSSEQPSPPAAAADPDARDVAHLCGDPTTTPTPVPIADSVPGEYTPVDGWVWYTDGNAFRVAVPGSWLMTINGTMTCFHDPTSPRVLGVTLSALGDVAPAGTTPADTALAATQRSEQVLINAGQPGGYQRVSLAKEQFDELAAADWEYTYNGSTAKLHVASRTTFRAPQRLLTLHWVTGDFDWTTNTFLYDMAVTSFRAL